jgi:RHS repeat-associated protein
LVAAECPSVCLFASADAYTPDASHPHAVNLVNGADRYDYDLNGNLALRNKGVANQEQVLAWDAQNRLSAVTYTNRTATGGGGGGLPTLCNGVPCKRVYFSLVMQQTPAERYSYDADGARVRKESKSEVTRIIGPHYEVVVATASGQVLTTTKYYDFGGQRIAVRQMTGQNDTLSYLHGDHLGSTSVTTSNSGAKTNDVRYYAYGGQRTGNLLALPTDHTFTGQKLDRGTGLLYYGARYYDSGLGMFISPDSIVPSPGDPQSLNRYSYVRNNPLGRFDPTGHADIPPISELMQQAIKFFAEQGWQVVGDPSKINPNWNGADLVFTREGGRVLAVELKAIAGKVNLGTLGWSEKGVDYGGSISRVARSAARFVGSSVEQLRLQSQTVKVANDAGTLENALFTSAEGVTQKAQQQFGAVYRVAKDSAVIAEKAVADAKQSGVVEKAAAAGSALTVAKDAAVSAATMLGSQPFSIPAPMILPRSVFEQFMQQYYGMYGSIQD